MIVLPVSKFVLASTSSQSVRSHPIFLAHVVISGAFGTFVGKCMDYPHHRVVTVSTSCSKQAVMYIVLSPLACHTMCWHFPTDDVGNPYSGSHIHH